MADKWTEIPYVQLFFFLKEHFQWMKQCKGGTQTLTMVCRNTPKERDTCKTPPTTPKGATSSFLPKGSEESGHPTSTAPLSPYSVAISCYPLQLVPGEGAATQKESMSPSD
jgi:hypothetical protein